MVTSYCYANQMRMQEVRHVQSVHVHNTAESMSLSLIVNLCLLNGTNLFAVPVYSDSAPRSVNLQANDCQKGKLILRSVVQYGRNQESNNQEALNRYSIFPE